MADPRILLVLNNCLSEHNSNGRTMLRLIGGMPRDSISQIYTSGEIADESFCGSCLRITNRDAIISYIAKPVCALPEATDSSHGSSPAHHSKKNALTMLLRDLTWDHSPRLKSILLDWSRKQQPDLILLQVGDASLHIRIATYLARNLDIPLLTYNTEDYYFKKHDYMRRTMRPGLFYRIFHHRFCRVFDELMKLRPVCLYNCDGLKELYAQRFGDHGRVLYCGSDFSPKKSADTDGPILYAGNLGIGRVDALIELGKALQGIHKELSIDVYGNAPADTVQTLRSGKGIRYHGSVDYSELRNLISKSRLLIHVESFDRFIAKDIQYAFSTKLADYMMSGVPILYFGPDSSEGARYLARNDMAFIVTNRECAEKQLRNALYDTRRRNQVVDNALRLAHENHDLSMIHNKFAAIIDETLRKEC